MTDISEPVAVGVIGVGSMGQHHARVYSELQGVELVGVYDADDGQAQDIATKNGVGAYGLDALLDQVEAVSVAVPTEHHYDIAYRCIERGIHVLVEKPFVEAVAKGEELIAKAQRNDVLIQVGHIERFNPAVLALEDIVPELTILGVEARRMGPPLERHIDDGVVRDLMIHDIDILLRLIDDNVSSMSAHASSGQYTTATFEFESDAVGTLTASRATQQKIRSLSISAESCQVVVDYIDQSVEIHRQSLPEYVEEGNDVRYRHESVIERPMIDNTEPLKNELESFVDAILNDDPPQVTGEDGLRAIKWVSRIEQATKESGS